MIRVFCPGWEGGARLPELSPEENHHLVRVRRVRRGETFDVLNGRGHIGHAEVISEPSATVPFRIQSVESVGEPALKIHLLVALPKGKTFSMLLPKCVELGAFMITPLITENVEGDADRALRKGDRWEALLIEALKQSGNPWLPRLNSPVSLEKALESASGTQRLCAALQDDALPLWTMLQEDFSPTGQMDLFVGPEGDFSPSEYQRLREASCRFASLGPRILRVETAASLLLGMLQLWTESGP